MTSNDLERLLTEAFDAQASRVTPEQLDTEREHAVRRQLAEPVPLQRRDRRGFYLAGAGLAAAALVVGAVVTVNQPHGTAQFAGESTSASRTGDLGVPQIASGTTATESDAPEAPSAATSRPAVPPTAASTSGSAGQSHATTDAATSTGEPSARPSVSAATRVLGQSGPLSVPETFVAEGERSSVPMPPGLTYEVLSSGPSSVRIRVSDFMQLARFLDNNSPLASWPRDGGGYHSPRSSMAASLPSALGEGSEGTFSLFLDPDDSGSTGTPTETPTTDPTPTGEPTATGNPSPTSDGSPTGTGSEEPSHSDGGDVPTP